MSPPGARRGSGACVVLGRLIARPLVAATLVVVIAAAGVAATALAFGLERDDDILAFLPAKDPDVQLFEQLNERFGGLDVALVGIEAPHRDALRTEFLRRLRRLTRELRTVEGLEAVLSLVNVTDFEVDRQRGGIVAGELVRELPRSDAEREALRRKVLSRDHVVGTFISRDASATVVYCFLVPGSDQRAVARDIRSTVRAIFVRNPTYWGGGPFVSSYIFDSTDADMRNLTPWAVLAMVVVMLMAFRDLIGTCLALLSTSLAIVIAIGTMVLFGVRMNLVLGSMPVILFAVGSAYGIHILARYYRERQQCGDPGRAVVATLAGAGPVVLAAGLTTVVSLLSFIAMDLEPMRVFGLFSALGVALALLLSLTFIPAVAYLVKLRGRPQKAVGVGPLARFVRGVQRRRILVGAVVLVVLAAGGLSLTRVQNRIDPSNLFSADSPPARADRFLQEHFGGSQFLQVAVDGDLEDPLLLRELQRIGDRLLLMEDVSGVVHIGGVLARANEAMEGQRRLPDTRAKASTLFNLISGETAVDQLVTKDRRHALMQVKLATSDAARVEQLLDRIESWLHEAAPAAYRAKSARTPAGARRLRRQVELRIRAVLAGEGVELAESQLSALRAGLRRPAPPVDRRRVAARLVRFLRSEECAVRLPPADDRGDPAQRVAAALVALGPSPSDRTLQRALAKTTPWKAEDVELDDLLLSVTTPLREAFDAVRALQRADALMANAAIAMPKASRARGRVRSAIGAATLELARARTLQPAPGASGRALRVTPSGLPVLHRSLARSALSNQMKSLGLALVPVLLIATVLFRSLTAGLLVASPTLLTLVLIYGGMGVLGVRLDIGTAMLACIILGAGVDYAVHLVAAWRDPEGASLEAAGRHAVQATGEAIWTNALAVSLGFAILTAGEARPLQNVGGLTAAAMVVAAAATFLLIPLLARRPGYGPSPMNLSSAGPVSNEAGELETEQPSDRQEVQEQHS